jgi:hypothetical protein
MQTILYCTFVINLTGNYHLQVRLFNRHQINQLAFIHRESTSKNGRRLKIGANYAKYSLLVGLVKGKKIIFLLVKIYLILPMRAVTSGYSMVLKAGSGCSSFSVNWVLFQDRCYQVETALVNRLPAIMVLPPRMELKVAESSKKLVSDRNLFILLNPLVSTHKYKQIVHSFFNTFLMIPTVRIFF